jgi:hypothetical protein
MVVGISDRVRPFQCSVARAGSDKLRAYFQFSVDFPTPAGPVISSTSVTGAYQCNFTYKPLEKLVIHP